MKAINIEKKYWRNWRSETDHNDFYNHLKSNGKSEDKKKKAFDEEDE